MSAAALPDRGCWAAASMEASASRADGAGVSGALPGDPVPGRSMASSASIGTNRNPKSRCPMVHPRGRAERAVRDCAPFSMGSTAKSDKAHNGQRAARRVNGLAGRASNFARYTHESMRLAAGFALFLCLLLPELPAAHSKNSLPRPESTFGFEPGADYKLATYDQSIEYFRKLDAASKYVTLVEAGRTTQGRPMYFALISSPANLAHIERYREIAQRLAHPAGLSEADARRLASEGKAFVHIDGGLHSTEVAGTQHTPLLAYNLVSRASEPDMKAILDNVVVMLWPTINPDGQQIVAEWYMKNVGTPYELSEVPTLYQEYVGHYNNRDAYMLNMIESRAIEHAWRQWEPQIVYVHHQSGPFPTRIWLPPFSEPVGTEDRKST